MWSAAFAWKASRSAACTIEPASSSGWETAPSNGADRFALVHSDAMHVTEKYRRRDVGHLDVEITIDDRKSYNRPFTFKVTHLLEVDSDMLEYVCNEGEKDLAIMKK